MTLKEKQLELSVDPRKMDQDSGANGYTSSNIKFIFSEPNFRSACAHLE